MPKEIEHKFLVQRDLLPKLPRAHRLIQGYLCIRPTVRVRLAMRGKSSKAWLTIKGPGLLAREEFEYAIPPADAKKLLKLCGSAVLEKNRYELKGWEIDEFLGRHTGLWMAEYELKAGRKKLPKLPEWIGTEVSSDNQYTNASLALSAGLP